MCLPFGEIDDRSVSFCGRDVITVTGAQASRLRPKRLIASGTLVLQSQTSDAPPCLPEDVAHFVGELLLFQVFCFDLRELFEQLSLFARQHRRRYH